MKKGLLTIFACAVALSLGVGATDVDAQSLSDITYGVRAGANMSKTADKDSKNLTSFAIGGSASYSVNEMLDIQAELLYSRQGQKYKTDGVKDLKMDFIKVPVLAKYTLPFDAGKVKFNVQGGAYFAYLLSAKQGDKDWKKGVKDGDKEQKLSNGDYGLTLGTGISMASPWMPDSDITVDFRYDFGLNKVGSNDDDKTRNIEIAFGYTF